MCEQGDASPKSGKNGATGATEDCNMLVFSVKTGARKGKNGATEVLP